MQHCGTPMGLFFFFQAEDGIRDADVTGVQTCALPISKREVQRARALPARDLRGDVELAEVVLAAAPGADVVLNVADRCDDDHRCPEEPATNRRATYAPAAIDGWEIARRAIQKREREIGRAHV